MDKAGLDSSLCFPTEERLKGHIIHLTQVAVRSESHHLKHREELHLTDFSEWTTSLRIWSEGREGSGSMKSDRLQSSSVTSESLYLSTGKRLIKRRTGLAVLGCIMLHPAMSGEMALREHTQLMHHLNKCTHATQLCVRSP